ncbi:MAG: uroporphyrinogen-III C-methyltransferase [Candidatus Omnitrophica bacterium]|nr:uroporphyrinogen-III C-methyltransferase [Candidatus Omnitrophota bacterium]
MKVYIVGAGPGDPELISVKGLKVLKKADCLLYDFLAGPALLRHTKRSCEKICVGKKDGLHLLEQKQINRLLADKAAAYRTVVRLKGGDPFVFSRGSEEARYLLRRGIPCEVIPGITSALAAPASFGIPLTMKGRVQSVSIITGHKQDPDAEIDAFAGRGTLVYLMAVGNVVNVVKALKKSGRPDSCPCAFIERGTCAAERIVRATVGTLVKRTHQAQVKAPAVLVVGEVVRCSSPG